MVVVLLLPSHNCCHYRQHLLLCPLHDPSLRLHCHQ
eukprot:COSAG05_NODE_12252_length_475_cov_0.962766_1_plen_35_part_10